MTCFLVRHELDQATSLRAQACSLELSISEAGKAVMEEVKLNPFLYSVSS